MICFQDHPVCNLFPRSPYMWSISKITLYVIYFQDPPVCDLFPRSPCMWSISKITLYVIYFPDHPVRDLIPSHPVCELFPRSPCMWSVFKTTLYVICFQDHPVCELFPRSPFMWTNCTVPRVSVQFLNEPYLTQSTEQLKPFHAQGQFFCFSFCFVRWLIQRYIHDKFRHLCVKYPKISEKSQN